MAQSRLPTKFIILTGIVGIGGGALALVSRFRLNAELNTVFKLLGLGQQSLVEHWLSAMSAVALFVLVVALFTNFSKKVPFKKTWLRQLWFIKLRKRVLNTFRSVYIAHWAMAIATIYIGVSLGWELKQMEQRGYFQVDQFSMDIIGSLGFCFLMWLSIKPEYRQARLKRRFYLS